MTDVCRLFVRLAVTALDWDYVGWKPVTRVVGREMFTRVLFTSTHPLQAGAEILYGIIVLLQDTLADASVSQDGSTILRSERLEATRAICHGGFKRRAGTTVLYLSMGAKDEVNGHQVLMRKIVFFPQCLVNGAATRHLAYVTGVLGTEFCCLRRADRQSRRQNLEILARYMRSELHLGTTRRKIQNGEPVPGIPQLPDLHALYDVRLRARPRVTSLSLFYDAP